MSVDFSKSSRKLNFDGNVPLYFEYFWLLYSGGTSQHSRNSIFMTVSVDILQDSILYFYIEDGTGVLLHWIRSLWTKIAWKERRTFPWRSFAMSTMDVNR